MTVSISPEIARDVASRLTGAMTDVQSAASTLNITTATNGTSELIVGIPLLASEVVQEAALVSTILTNLADASEHADVFSGAGSYFIGLAGQALAQLEGSGEDGIGDLGSGDGQSQLDRLTDEIWPDGIPAGLSDADVVETLLNDPRAGTLTQQELADIWPHLPADGREAYAADYPVVVLDIVVDAGLKLSDAELDAAARSIIASPPTMDIDVSSALDRQLIDAAFHESGWPNIDRTAVALDRADILTAAGAEGRAYRDAENMPVTYISLVVGLQAGGTPSRTDDGLIVVVLPRGNEVSIDDVLGGDVSGYSFQPYGKGGTTYGNTFIVPGRRDGQPHDDHLLHHENIHTYQWAAAGPLEYPALYALESVNSGINDFVTNTVDVDADLAVDVGVGSIDLGPMGPSGTPSFDLPGPGWLPDIPSVPLPQFDPPAIPVPTLDIDIDVDVDIDPTFNTGCGNRFEQHADLEDGNYTCD